MNKDCCKDCKYDNGCKNCNYDNDCGELRLNKIKMFMENNKDVIEEYFTLKPCNGCKYYDWCSKLDENDCELYQAWRVENC